MIFYEYAQISKEFVLDFFPLWCTVQINLCIVHCDYIHLLAFAMFIWH